MKIVLDEIHKWYNRNQPNEVHALKSITLKVGEGEVVCVQGPSGSGKSTLLGIIGCLFPPTSGLVEIDGKRLSRLPDRFLTLHRRQKIGFVFQKFQMIDELSVLENIVLPLLPAGLARKEYLAIAENLMELMKISHRRDFPVSEISGGEIQRTAIARALVYDPPIILADEPTAHLDTALSMEFMDLVEELRKKGKTVIITSHDARVSGHQVIDRCLAIHDGRFENRES